ncbi:hypothetical protein FLAV_00666 [Flavobacteriales bacterium]|nr:hypothetical protein [Flavobacteriales bacterium]MCL4815365.1 hypothetical protein [Flavobacteriales bacterium]WKZ74984.1 MAG: hypothetical protein QY303_12645 [Vicingaceae bacterium]GIK69926.1 MAG: hypothetical protein BroJett020_12210 [Bacteroidota bacterium]CAG0960322.1 hypothetical protein FLAV_00666 [Flavobacteriales bacterium]
MKKFLFFIVTLNLAITLAAQDYKTGVGLRLGWESGIIVKHFLDTDAAVEGIIGTSPYWGGFYLCGLYELHAKPFEVEGLSLFYGGGAHIRSWAGGGWGVGNPRNKYYNSYFGMGVDAIVGLEYKVPEAPISISLDVKPAIDVIESFWIYGGGALGIRYTF